MAVQHIFISIKESAPIRNLSLFSIVAVANHQLAHIIESYGTLDIGKHIFVSEQFESNLVDMLMTIHKITP